MKECYRPWQGSNPRPPGLQSDAHPTEPPRPALIWMKVILASCLIRLLLSMQYVSIAILVSTRNSFLAITDLDESYCKETISSAYQIND